MNLLDKLRRPLSSRSSDLRHKIVLTYDNTKMTDGVGAQLQRIYGIYSISRLLGVSYLHSPLKLVEYQGLRALKIGSADPEFHQEFNDICQIKSDVTTAEYFRPINLLDLSMKEFHKLITMYYADKSDRRPYLLRLAAPYAIGDSFPDCYEVCKEISPFASPASEGRALRVAIHVRRGELAFLDAERILPDHYYISVAQNVVHLFEALGIDYEIELHSEAIDKEFIVQPDQPGIFNRISSPVVVGPRMYRLEIFSILPHLVPCINEKAIDCLRKLATADILIMSKSSFSYIAALLNRNGIILYHPFWHPAPSSWITVDPRGQFNQPRFRDLIKARHHPALRRGGTIRGAPR
jgi:hypothetical protein